MSVALNANEEGRGGARWGRGRGPEQLGPPYRALVFTADLSTARIHNIIQRSTQLLAVFCKYSIYIYIYIYIYTVYLYIIIYIYIYI